MDDFKAITGKGAQGLINGKQIAIGNDKMMEQAGTSLSEKQSKVAEEFQNQGKTVSFLSIEGTVTGYVVISDAIKDTSAKAIKELQDQGISVMMLTGDNEYTAKYVADTLQLSAYKAACLPEDKLKEIENFFLNYHLKFNDFGLCPTMEKHKKKISLTKCWDMDKDQYISIVNVDYNPLNLN